MYFFLEWEEAAQKLAGSVKLGAVDATVHSNLGSKFQGLF